MLTQLPYEEFLKKKVRLAQDSGFDLDISTINPALKLHNKLMVKWMVNDGRRACFASFGLHKTVTQLEAVRCTLLKTGGRGLIICPLGVRQEFVRDSKKILGWDEAPKFIRNISEAEETGIYLTNYETVRVNMKLLGLVSPFCKKRTILPALTSKQKVFILSNYKKMTVTELKKALNIDYFIVWRFLKKNNLSAEKLSYKDKPQIIIPEEPVKKTSFERPPAVYSNTNYQQAYL